jgi:hypothetical protein
MSKKERIIRNAFLELDSPSAFTAIENVLRTAKRSDPAISQKDVVSTLQGEATYTLHRPRRITRIKRLTTMPSGLNSDWQADLADFQNIKTKNKGMNYLLVCIDVLSRKIYVEPIKTKGTQDMQSAFDKIFAKADVKPLKITSDRGKEFESPAMKAYFARNAILKHVVFSTFHAGVVERSIRTIKMRLYKYFTQYRTVKWLDVIDKVVDGINNSINRTIGVTPNSVNKANAQALYRRVFKIRKENNPNLLKKFQKGDIVRFDSGKGIFEKSYLPNYTEELFRIRDVKKTMPVHYKVEDLEGEEISGVFYPMELAKTRLMPNARISQVIAVSGMGANKKYKVHWIGESKDNDEWINESDPRYVSV